MEIEFKASHVYVRLSKNWHNRYIIAYGGSSSSKSISILQKLTIYALSHKNKRITISAESLPVLKKTIIPDWKEHVMQAMFEPNSFNRSEMVYTFPTGSVFQFIPADDERSTPPSFRVIGSHAIAAQGVSYGEINGISQVEQCLLRAMQTVQRQAGVRADHAMVCFSGGDPMSEPLSGEARVENGEVSKFDVAASLENCEFPHLVSEREWLHALPVNFTLDHRTGLRRAEAGAGPGTL